MADERKKDGHKGDLQDYILFCSLFKL